MTRQEPFLPRHLVRNFSVVGVWTLASRILGFIRDILIARFLGSGPIAEAFLVAFTLPNMFRRLFAEGAFNTAFIPMLSKRIADKNNPEKFASDALSILIAMLLILTAVAEIMMSLLVYGMASGFSSDNRFNLSVAFGRVMFPYVFLISLSTFLGAVLNSLNKFSVAAAVPLLLNMFFIFALLIAHIFELDFGWALSLSVPLAGTAQLVLTIVFIKKEPFVIKLKKPKLTPDILRLFKIAFPAALAGGVIQINLIVGRQVGSYFEGAVAWLNYADRIYQLPLGIVAIAIGVVLLPNLSKTSKNNTTEGNNLINRSTEFALLLTLPATCALVLVPHQIIATLFERGAFTVLDTINTSQALFVYAIGLPAFVFQKILSTIYFSHGDTKSPFKFALIGMITNLILAIGLTSSVGFLAPAVGTTVSGWLIAFLLWKKSNQFDFYFDHKFKKICLKLSFACLALSFFIVWYMHFLSSIISSQTTSTFSFVLLILSSSILYFFVCTLLGLKNLFFKNQ